MCTKNKSNLSTVQREAQRKKKLCTNLSPDICTRYFVSLRFTFCTSTADWSMEGIVLREDFFYQHEIGDNSRRSKKELVTARFLFSHVKCGYRDDKFIRTIFLLHSAKCSCYEYDGVLLLIIIITVMVIINNYLMMWCSFTWWDLSVYCF